MPPPPGAPPPPPSVTLLPPVQQPAVAPRQSTVDVVLEKAPYPPGAVPAQALVGNAAVVATLTRTPAPPAGTPVLPAVAATAAPPAPPPGAQPSTKDVAAPGRTARPGPDRDPKFAALKKGVHATQRRVAGSHPPPTTEAGAAQAAARPPADDKVAQGKAANADKMNAAQPKPFDKAAFIKAVEDAIAKRAPKNLEEADQFSDSDKPEEVKKDIEGRVTQGQNASASEIATTTAAPPDTSKAVEKKVVPLTGDRPPGVPDAPDPHGAVPDQLPPSATDTSAGPASIDRQMSDAQVTDTQLANSNEPQFVDALHQKKTAQEDSPRATAAMRQHEKTTLDKATAQAHQLGTAGMHDIAGTRVATGHQVDAGKRGAKGTDEDKRAQVTAALQKVFDATKTDVESILNGLDRKVDDQFSREEKVARDQFTTEHKTKMAQYKAKRYGGWLGPARWVKDKLLGLPAEANQIFVEARDHYVTRMRTVISDVADTIGTELDRAKARIAKGRDDLRDAVAKLPADLRAIGRDAAADFAGKFDDLVQSVDDKGNALVDTLADKYTAALKSVDDEIAKEKAKNEGLVNKAIDAVKDTIKTINDLKNLLLGVLRKAGSAIMMILRDPIGFLRNLVSAVGAGLKLFLKNIVQHLEQGLVSWLLGVTAQAGIQLPRSFDIKGILLLIASLLGLTWGAIRTRIVHKGVPDQAVTAAETAVPLAAKAKREGVGGLWDDIKGQVGDLKHTLISKVTEYLLPTIIVAGITWVLSLLNPASAFVRACKLIIDIVQFVVERGRQVIDFVNAVLDAVIAIAKGGGGGVPALVENALARSIPVLIGFLASLLGIGGIADKVKKIFQTLSKPVEKAIDWVIDKLVGLVKKLWAKLKGLFGKGKRGRHREDGKDEDSRAPAVDDRSEAAKRAAVASAIRSAGAAMTPEATREDVRRALPPIRARYQLTELSIVDVGPDVFRVRAVVNPSEETPEHVGAVEVSRDDLVPDEPAQSETGWIVVLRARTPLGPAEWGTAHIQPEASGGPHAHIDKHLAKLPDGRTIGLTTRFSVSDYALEIAEMAHSYIFGKETRATQGELVDTNLKNFQKEYVAVAQQFPRESEEVWADVAIRKISFGRVRVERGYRRFEFVELSFGKQRVDGILVPARVIVIARK